MPRDPVRIADTRAWLLKAHDDLRGAQIDLDADPPLLGDVFFHCQQAIEKILKAFLTWHDTPFRKTHDLVVLGGLCVEIDDTLESLLRSAAPLTEYAWKFRYPGDVSIPDLSEAKISLTLAKRVLDALLARLPSETHPSSVIPVNDVRGDKTMNFRGKLVDTSQVVTVQTDGEQISAIHRGEAGDAIGGDDVWIAPAIFDVQVNGVGGINYKAKDLTVEKIVETAAWMHRTGTGLWCPTVTTSSEEDAIHGLALLAKACEESEVARASFVGFHVEGPYIASEDGPRGAHPLAHVRDPDWDEFQRYQEAAGGRIAIFTLAPERDGALEFIEKVAATGVIVSIGHSGASPERIQEAVAAGAQMSTHLGNGAHAELPRHPNYIWEQLAADALWAGIIPDGFHLPPAVLKSFYRAKGKERLCLVSDVASIAGLSPGIYGSESGLGQSELHANGKISLAGTPYLAGAGLFLDSGIPNAVRFTDASLSDAIEMTSINPARLLGIEDRVGSVEVGKEASLSLFRWEEGQDKLDVVATVVRGQVVYQAA